MSIDRTKFNLLVDDDGTNATGSVWNKTAIKDVILDPVDAAIVSSGVTLPINLTTQVTGTLQAAQEPAHSGDVTNSAGSLALAIGAGKVTSTMIAAGGIAPTKITLATVVLTDGATVALDVISRAAYYRLVAAGDRIITTPQNPLDGQKIIIQHVASGGARTLTIQNGFAFAFRFGTDIPGLTATASGKTDYIGAIYNATDQRWDVVAYTKGF
jgi:hypothetical protein